MEVLKLKVYTDGSAHPNPGPGGYGIVVVDDDDNLMFTYGHQVDKTTNNEMEMKAILLSLALFGKNDETITVCSDSSYAINSFVKWMPSWQRNGWIKASDNQPPKNLDILQSYYDLITEGYKINLEKVSGHSGNKWNDLADAIATGSVKPTYDRTSIQNLIDF